MKTPADFRPGDTFQHARTCDRYRPLYYAAASGDFNPIHVDAEFARMVGLPGNILQGMCTFAWLAEACAGYLEDPLRVRRLFARFSRPVAIDDEVRFEGRCVSADGGRVVLEVAARNQRGEEVLKGAAAEASVASDIPSPPRSDEGPTPCIPSPPRSAGERQGEGAPFAGPSRTYGPYRYAVGLEKIRDFALAIAGGVPTRAYAWPADPPPHPWFVDERAAAASPYGGLVAPPTFGAVYGMTPFTAALSDPENGIDLGRVVHGEQELRLGVPVRPGDVLETTGALVSREQRGKLEVFTVRSRSTNQRGEVVLEGSWAGVVR